MPFARRFLPILLVSSCWAAAVSADDQTAAAVAGSAEAAEATTPVIAALEGDFASAILMDAATGMVLAAKNPDTVRQPASMLKMLTELIVLEMVAEGDIAMTDTVEVSARASRMGGSQVYLAHGERFTVEELLAALAIHSANDAAVALAEYAAGSVEAFVDLMNARARRLGMTSSEFHTVHGLPAGRDQQPDLTTARDMAILGRELLGHPEALVWSSQSHAPFRDGEFVLTNPNRLVDKYRGLDGLKTGYHGQAGYCVTATAVQKDVRLISVVMGCPTDRGRATETTRLLSFGFDMYEKLTLVEEAGTPLDRNVAIKDGRSREVAVRYADPVVVTAPRTRHQDVELRVELDEPVAAPVAEGEKVGEAIVVLDGHELARVDLVAAASVAEGNWFHRLFN